MRTPPILLAIRPKTLTASISPVLLGLFLSSLYIDKINYLTAALTIGCALLMQIATNLVNDYHDFKSGVDANRSFGPTRVTSQGLISANRVKKIYQLCFALAFTFGIKLMLSGGLPIVIIGMLSLIFAYIYTAGPFPLSHHGLGEITAFIFFGPVAVWGSAWLQTVEHQNIYLIAGLGPGLIASLLMAINNLRDINDDRKSGKMTIAIRLGEKRARLFCILLILLTGLLPLALYFKYLASPFLIIPAISPLFFYKSWKRILYGPIGAGLNQVLADSGKLMFIYSLGLGLALKWN